MIGENAWDNGSWIRTPGDTGNSAHRQAQEAKEFIRRRRAEEQKAAWRARVLVGPERVMKQYRNAVRKTGLMAVSEALGLG